MAKRPRIEKGHTSGHVRSVDKAYELVLGDGIINSRISEMKGSALIF